MPLTEGKSEHTFHKNIKEMVEAGHPVKQAVAAAYQEKKEAESHGKR